MFRASTGSQRSSPNKIKSRNTQVSIYADDLREQGETANLLGGMAITFVVLLFLLRVTFGAIIVIILASIFWLKVRQGQLLGQAVKVSSQQLPGIHALVVKAASRLQTPLPDVFVVQDPTINAYAIGSFGRKSIVLNSATIESMDEDELCYIIGHELTHIKCDHTQWMVFTSVSDTISLPVVSSALGFVFRGWSRKAEYTADRGGLVACQNLRAAFSALCKVAVGKELFEQLNISELMAQKDEVDSDITSKFSETLGDHPYIINRTASLQNFASSSYYKQLCGIADDNTAIVE